MDISNDVVPILARHAKVDVKKALRSCIPVRLEEDGKSLKLSYYSNKRVEPDIPDLIGNVTWKQIFEIMDDVEKTGTTNVIKKTGFKYLQKDYGR